MNDVEEWRAVVGWEGLYEVSDLGRVRSLDRVIFTRRSLKGTRRLRGKVLAAELNTHGYLQVALCRHGRRVGARVHTLVLEAFEGLRPVDREARHADNDRANARRVNLSWGTHSENMLDQIRHGTNRKASQTHCLRQHLLAAPNLKPSSLRRGGRECLACGQAKDWVRYHPGADLVATADRYYTAIMQGQLETKAG